MKFNNLQKTENRFVIIAPMFNATKTLSRMLHSIMGQSYKNWKLILIDDVSHPSQLGIQRDIVELFKDHDQLTCSSNDRITFIENNQKKWEVANILQGLSHCNDEDIICRVDPDDFITDLDAFRLINEVYNDQQCDCLWTAHRWHDDERVTHNNISGQLPEGCDPYRYQWVSSHMKTFRKRLLNNVSDENYRGEDGEYFKRIGDQTFMLPALYHSKKNVYLPMVMYSYYCPMKPQTFQSDDAKFQKAEAEFLRKRGYVK